MTTPPRDREPHPADPTRKPPGVRAVPAIGDGVRDRSGPSGRRQEAGAADVAGARLKSDNLRLPDPEAGRLPKSARNVLSREEIEALLNPDLTDLPVARPEPAAPASRGEGLLSEHKAEAARALTEACDRLIARLSHAFQASGAIKVVLRLAAAETRPFRSTVDSQQGPGVFVCLSDATGRVGSVLMLSPEAASALIERAGGASEALALSAPARNLTALDAALLADGLAPLQRLFPVLGEVRVYPDRLKAGATIPPGEAIRLSLTLQIGTRAWPATLLLDTRLIERAGPDSLPQPAAEAATQGAPSEPSHASGAGQLTTLLTARVASLSVQLSALSDLRPGATLRLNLPADSPVSLLSGGPDGTEVARGALGREGNRIAIRLTHKRRAFS